MRAKKILKSTVTVLLAVLIYISFMASFLAISLDSTLGGASKLALRAADGEYCREMYASLMRVLERKTALVVIKTDDIADLLDEGSIANETKLAAVSVVAELFGTEGKEWSYENEALRERIDTLLREYSEAEGIEYADGSADKVYEMITETVTAELRTVSSAYISKVSPLVGAVKRAASFWYLPLILFALLVACLLIYKRRHMRHAVYYAVLPTYLAAFTVFDLSHIMYVKDYLGSTVLGDTMLQGLIRRLYTVVFRDLSSAAAVLSVIFLIAGIAVGVAISLKHRRSRHSSHSGFSHK